MHANDPLERFLSGYAAAVRARDIDAFLALYDESLHVFDMWQAAPMTGLADWRGMAEAWFGGLGEEVVVVTWRQANSRQEGDLAIGHAIVTFAAHAPDGSVLRSLDNRFSVGLRHTPRGWKVFHEHSSAPVQQSDLRAVLSLP